MLTIIKSVFNGRANPTGTISDAAAENILRPIARNQDGITTVIRSRQQGYTTLIVENDGGGDPYGLPERFYVNDGYAQDTAAGLHFYQEIMASVELQKPTYYGPPRTYYTSDESNRDILGPYTRTDWTNDGKIAVQLADYVPDYWNNTSNRLRASNCFAYATNINTGWDGRGIPEALWLHPGYCRTQRVPTNDTELASGIHGDAIATTDSPNNDIKGTSDDPAWIVAVVTGHPTSDPENEWDYHLYRKVWHATLQEYVWGHKPGGHPVEYIRDNVANAPIEHAKKNGYDKRYGNGYCTIYHNRLCSGSGL